VEVETCPGTVETHPGAAGIPRPVEAPESVDVLGAAEALGAVEDQKRKVMVQPWSSGGSYGVVEAN
jgi:hypothetical protein